MFPGVCLHKKVFSIAMRLTSPHVSYPSTSPFIHNPIHMHATKSVYTVEFKVENHQLETPFVRSFTFLSVVGSTGSSVVWAWSSGGRARRVNYTHWLALLCAPFPSLDVERSFSSHRLSVVGIRCKEASRESTILEARFL